MDNRPQFPLPILRHPFPARGPPPVIPTDDTDATPEASQPTANSTDDPVTESDDMGSSTSRPAHFQPSALDVLVTKAMLAKGVKLPIEVVDLVVDFAEYWPHTRTHVERPSRPNRFGTRPDENNFLLRTPPVGFLGVPHSDPERYTREPVKMLRLSDEHPVEQFQKWIGSPVPLVQHPCRKVVFTIKSRDQGWGGDSRDHGTYHGSWTWFEAGLERVDASGDCGDHCPDTTDQPAQDQTQAQGSGSSSRPRPEISLCALRSIRPEVNCDGERTHFDFPLNPADDKVQCNMTAHNEYITHVVEWRATDNIDPKSAEADGLEKMGRGRASGTGEFVRNLKLGDTVTLWAKTRFQGWANNVESATVDVYWAI
ncbi:hypothetical protein MCOR02_000075 [Pyricularia oryzae]|nr:hypothetical protein MCOR02_000075 [Pyricularia oryzae]KAI6327490.1 hypothetical protein MCOR34_000456 [Pyricularia oryzae]KAI6475548.1 hypothetical protein MCOR17_001477 [Pyricularia oryzae]KAI6571057.1 hypothetical protein MCOR04_007913 [Pyricularia oryzae]KAI6639749.1 hypothetical protein MCOR14_003782 [Pyricularia oryzae]